MHVMMDDFDSRLLSGRLWRGFAPPTCGPLGGVFESPSGNPAIGFFDDFFSFQATTLEGPYKILETGGDGGITVEQVADTANEKGNLALTMDSGSANDEAVLQWGRGLCAPFKLTGKDLVFEIRFKVSAITAAKWSIAVGLGDVGMGATDKIFADTTGAMATDADWLGFAKLLAEGASWDGAYKVASQTYQDGATKTKLDSLHTMVADTYVKMGFRYRAHPKTLEWYVNNSLPGGHIAPAKLTATEIDAATFPDDTFLAPVFGVKNVTADTALTVNIDWWACAQLL